MSAPIIGKIASSRTLRGTVGVNRMVTGRLADKTGPGPGEIIYGPLCLTGDVKILALPDELICGHLVMQRGVVLADAPGIIYQEGEI